MCRSVPFNNRVTDIQEHKNETKKIHVFIQELFKMKRNLHSYA